MKIFKIILVGDSGVGKSSFINRFCHHNFDQFQRVTIGNYPGLHNKPVIIDDKVVMLEIWDTVGQERFDSLPRSYFRRADGIIALFDITSKDSFENIPTWLSHIEDWVENPPLLIMVGNKLDISDQRKVSIEDGFQMAFDHNAMYAETSARTGEHVFETCHQLAR
ncbi:uncharacterized protein TRIADDRAFT_20151 [Trichoplax adhaerens]|uniref:Uncharacterized protein n=1 Tax=Trichoplax adhaerens TaxID=10228 RepID=B3RL19_TRIAD|nr:hypothetical protein TRIADDRAFT_20151 [Trichoplax adhaerens]EDV29471.1 hypothetical protein TRIADDRAFT_20151 [Trichoplax adhaerens]|eukprot:XP_002108673.1 hypothetical protein TRIADDRAFT_20151 [Trichoplax adhaerens]